MHEPSTEGRARIRAPIPFDHYQKKRVDGGWAMKTLRMCCFHVYFSRHDFDKNLLSSWLKTIERYNRKLNVFLILIWSLARVYSINRWISWPSFFSKKRTFFDKDICVTKQAVLAFLSFLFLLLDLPPYDVRFSNPFYYQLILRLSSEGNKEEK